MIRFSHVTKEYPGGFTAIRDVSFSVEKGEFLVLCGPSGAGKTTVLKHLYLEERPTSGRVVVCGFDSSKIRERQIPRLRRMLGIVFQDFRLLDDRTVFENVAFALRAAGRPERTIKRRVFELLAETGLSHTALNFPSQLSGGEQQRVCIARAIANDPWVLCADEPTGNLDAAVSQEILSLLRSINSRGTTVILATHDLQIIEPYHYRRILLSQGSIIRS